MKKMVFTKKSVARDIFLELAFKGLPAPIGITETPSGEITLEFDDKVTDAELESVKTAIEPLLSDRVFKKIIMEVAES